MGVDDDDGGATRVWLGADDEPISVPTSRLKWKALGLLLLGAAVIATGIAVASRGDAHHAEPLQASSSVAVTADETSGWRPPLGTSETIEISAVGFPSFSREDLGTLFDGKLRQLPGSPNIFRKTSVLEFPRNEFEHAFTRVTSQLELGIVVASLLGGSYRRDRYYALYRALDVTSVLRADDRAPMVEPPALAIYYLAELHHGSSYDVVIEGSSRDMGARLDRELTKGQVDLKAGLSSANYHVVQKALGLRPRNGAAIFARTPDEVASAYTTAEAAVPVRLVFRQISGRKLPVDSVAWPTPFMDDTFSLQDGKSKTFEVPAGTYTLNLTTHPNGVVVDWGGAKCRTGDFLEVTTACKLPSPTKLTITNWTEFGMGDPEEVTLSLLRGHDASAIETSREGH
jgi:hypothetical protein